MLLSALIGIGSAVIGGLASVGGAIATAMAPVAKALVPVAAKVGNTLTKYAGTAISKITDFLFPRVPGPIIDGPRLPFPEPRVDIVMRIVEKVCDITRGIMDVLGIGKKEDGPIELGAKAIKSAKTIDDFDDDAEEYINYLNDNVEVTEEEIDGLTEEQKLAYESIGMSLNVKAVEQNLEVNIPPEFLGIIGKAQNSNKIALTPEIVLDIVKGAKNAGIVDMKDIVEYLQGEGESDRLATGKALKEGLKNSVKDPDEFLEDFKVVVRE